MNSVCWRLAHIVARMLAPDERDAVEGDFAESGETGGRALRQLLGLVARRQAALWNDRKPWLALFGWIIPFGFVLSLASGNAARQNATYVWLYANNWDWALLRYPGFWYELAQTIMFVSGTSFRLVCWSWTAGFVLGSISRRTVPASAVLFCLALVFGGIFGAPQYLAYLLQFVDRPLAPDPNAPISALAFYRTLFPLVVLAVLVAIPSIWGLRQGASIETFPALLRIVLWTAATGALVVLVVQQPGFAFLLKAYWLPPIWQDWRIRPLQLVVYWPAAYFAATALWRRWHARTAGAMLFFILAHVAAAADQPALRAALQPATARQPAADFALENSSGKIVRLKHYRGKVILLDFWATWCTGCKKEIPWFSEFQIRYRAKGLAVIGVSMDEGGWNVLRPFLAHTRVPYPMLLGDQSTFHGYGIQSLPDTFLIDRQGRIAAAYKAGLVDKDNLEANLKALLSGR